MNVLNSFFGKAGAFMAAHGSKTLKECAIAGGAVWALTLLPGGHWLVFVCFVAAIVLFNYIDHLHSLVTPAAPAAASSAAQTAQPAPASVSAAQVSPGKAQ